MTVENPIKKFPVRKTRKMYEAEERFDNEPLEELLPRLINESGSTGTAANKLGVSKSTLGYWLLKLRIRIRSVAVKPGETISIISNNNSTDSTDSDIS